MSTVNEDGPVIWPLVEVRVAELHPTRTLMPPGWSPGDPEPDSLGGAVVLAEYRGTRGGAAALLRRLADELDFPLRKVVVTADELDLRQEPRV